MWPRARKHQSAPALEGRYYKFVLEKPPVAFDVLAPHAAPDSSRAPYVLMHMRKRGGQTRVAAPELTTAVDVADTPADAAPMRASGAASQPPPADLSEEDTVQLTGFFGKLFFGHLSLPGAATNPESAPLSAMAASCAHCGKGAKTKGPALKRCPICKYAWYCRAACQKAAWKVHKQTCAPPLPLGDVRTKLRVAHYADDWRGVLDLERYMEDLLENQRAGGSDKGCEDLLWVFMRANDSHFAASSCRDAGLAAIRLAERRMKVNRKP